MKNIQYYSVLLSAALMLQIGCDAEDTAINDSTPGGSTTGGAVNTGGNADPMGGVSMGGTADPTGGTADPMGGTADPMGGTPAGGEMMGGTMDPVGGEMMAEERVGPGDTDALACMGEYCPSARLSGLEIPSDANDASARGCRLAGVSNGSSLGGLLSIAGDVDTNSFVRADENGEIQLILLNSLAGWMDGATGNDAGELTANFYTGDAAADGSFSISQSSFDESGAPLINFPATTVTDGLIKTPRSDFQVSLPLLEGVPLSLNLSQTQISGFVSLDEVGFNLSEGVLEGYLAKDALLELVSGIYNACQDPEAPDLCATVGGFLSGNAEADLGLLLSFIPGGYDTAIAPSGEAVACTGANAADCNAISVCILIEMESANISGIGD
jgi:hypothetical protein